MVPSDGHAGARLHELVSELFPICRSITGDGVRETLARLSSRLRLEIHEIPTGTSVLDWIVPKEWNVRDAWVAGPDGTRVIDIAWSNLHVVGYSIPVSARMPLAELRPHLHSRPDVPDVIPYRTSYYREDWGFCLEDTRLRRLVDGEYEVHIDATLADGSLTYGELVLPGASDESILVSAHVCHPSLANDNLSGVAVAAAIAGHLMAKERRHTFRFLFAPGTIGAIAWLARNHEVLPHVVGGLVLTGVGDGGAPTYKRSRRGDAPLDRALAHLLAQRGRADFVLPFSPVGYDERQFCSPGFDLPVGCLMRTPFGQYREYHTSADNLAFVRPYALADSLDLCLDAIDLVERNACFTNTHPFGEPQFARHGLSGAVGDEDAARKWLLSCSDGVTDLLAVSSRSGLDFEVIAKASSELEAAGLLRRSAAGRV